MATLFSPSAIISPPSSTKPLSKTQLPPNYFNFKPFFVASAASATTILLFSSPIPSSASEASSLHLYYGTAANYGGYGGNASKKDTAEYTYLVPDSWKERLVSKIEKGTNGTDSEFYNPKKIIQKGVPHLPCWLPCLGPKRGCSQQPGALGCGSARSDCERGGGRRGEVQ